MLELLEELRRLDFSVMIVTGGGTEFVRAVSQDLYGVPPEAVVGTLIEYDYTDDGDRPVLRRTTRLLGAANEGAPKVSNIQTQLGRRPILAAGNSGGDREMLEWAATGEGPTLALLVNHDDDDARVQLRQHRADLRRVRADHRGRRSAGLDGGQHGERLGDGVLSRRCLTGSSPTDHGRPE